MGDHARVRIAGSQMFGGCKKSFGVSFSWMGPCYVDCRVTCFTTRWLSSQLSRQVQSALSTVCSQTGGVQASRLADRRAHAHTDSQPPRGPASQLTSCRLCAPIYECLLSRGPASPQTANTSSCVCPVGQRLQLARGVVTYIPAVPCIQFGVTLSANSWPVGHLPNV